jgi:hypothetical protein
VAVEELRVTQRGKTGSRIDITTLSRHRRAPGLYLLAPGAVPAIGKYVDTYLLAGDPSGTPASYSYAYGRTRAPAVKVGVKAFGADVSLTCAATIDSNLSIAFELPSGVDYELHQLAKGHGILWA